METLRKWKVNNLIKLETLWQKVKLLIKINFYCCNNTWKVAICFCMWERVNSGYSQQPGFFNSIRRKKLHLIHFGNTHVQFKRFKLINPFPHIEAFWRLCSRQLFENIVTKEEIAQNEQFLLLPQCFPLLVIGYPYSIIEMFYLLTNYVQSLLLQNCRMRERVNNNMSWLKKYIK